jgi:hypothetical protein
VVFGETFKAGAVLFDSPGVENEEYRDEDHPDGRRWAFHDLPRQFFGDGDFLVEDELFASFECFSVHGVDPLKG